MNKTKQMIQYLIQCDEIVNSSLYMNFLEAEKDNTTQFISESTVTLSKYIDGSEQKRFAFSIADYRSITYNNISKRSMTNENLEKLNVVQGIIDWVKEQNEIRNFPDFGEKCFVESIDTTEETPNITGIQDSQGNPPLAVYAITVIVDYIDYSKRI